MPEFNFGEIPIKEQPNNRKNENTPKEGMTRRKFLAGAAAALVSMAIPKEIDKIIDENAQLSSDEKEPSEFEKLKDEIRKENEPSMEMQNLAIEIQSLAHQIAKKEELLPSKLFTKNFFIAVSIQESNLDKAAQSEAGAIGIMQIKPVTIKEVIRYLNILERQEKIKFDGPQKTENLSDQDINDLALLTKKNPDLGQSFGKIYFADLFDNFKIGQDIFALGGITKTRKKLLAAYNWNPKKFKENETNEEAWPIETQDYYKKIFKYMDILKEVQLQMDALKMQTDIYELSSILTVELRKYEKEIDNKDPHFEKIIQNITLDYLKDIKEMEEIKGRAMKSAEIKRLIKSSNSNAYKNFLVSRF